MGGQQIERREAMRVIGLVSLAAGFPGFNKWAFACGQHSQEAAGMHPAQSKPYEPMFFSDVQYKTICRLSEMILPSDGGPGASEAGVSEFIDFMVAKRAPVAARREIRCVQDAIEEGNEAQNRFRGGIAWLNARSVSEFGTDFLHAQPGQQSALLEELAYRKKYKPGTEYGREFFQLVRDYTVAGFYTSRVGLETLGYPGLRTVWPSMPGCNHPDDPEHTQVVKPRLGRDQDAR